MHKKSYKTYSFKKDAGGLASGFKGNFIYLGLSP